ncbi:MAG: caspase family protein [Planctomycetota bacterium]
MEPGSTAGWLALPSPQAPTPHGRRRALLIGINDYVNPDIPDLRGCENDVLLLRHVLERRYGFDEVEVLLDRQATRAAILDRLREVVTATGPDDFLFVHYSGHGSQQADQNGDEQDDGLDETLVASDSRHGEVIDIVDDEIDDLLAGLDRAAQCVISLDACHSGTGTRETTALRTRDLPPDPHGERYRNLQVVRRRGGSPYLLITSALPREPALDGPVEGAPHGLFTLALARVLAEQPLPGEGDLSRCSVASCEVQSLAVYRDIVDGLGCAHRASTPTFAFVGFHDPLESKRRWQSPLLPMPRPGHGARLPWLSAHGSGEHVRLQDGARLGAAVGSCWALFGPGETAFAAGGALAWGTIEGHDGDDARLVLQGDDSRTRAYDDCRAVRIAPGDGRVDVPVKLQVPVADQQRARAALRQFTPRARLVPSDPGTMASFVLRKEGASGRYEVLAGDERTAVDVRDTLEDAARVVARTLTATQLLALQNPTSTLRVSISTDLFGSTVEDREVGVMRPKRRPPLDAGYHTYREEDGVSARNCLQVHVEVDRQCYVTIVDVDARGVLNLLFPNEMSEENGYLPDGLIPGGVRVSIPDAVRDDCQAGFLLPFLTSGHETIRAFACTELATAQRIRDAVREARARQQAAPDDPSAVDDVLRRLRDDLTRVSLREVGVMGVGVVTNRPRRRPQVSDGGGAGEGRDDEAATPQNGGDWRAASVSFDVAEAGR